MAKTTQVAFRLDAGLVDALDRYAAKMTEEQPGLAFTRADAVRVLLTRGLREAGIGPGSPKSAKRAPARRGSKEE